MDRKKSWSLDGLLSNSVLPLTNLPRESGQSRLETGAASTSPGPGRAALWGLRCVWQGPSPCLEPRLSSFPLPCLSPFTSFCLVSPSLPRPGALLPTSRPLRGFPGAPSLQCLRTGGCHGLPDTAAEMWSPMSRRDSDLKVELIVSQSVLFVGNLSRPHILENNFKTSVKFGHLFWNRRTVVPGRCVNDQVTQLRPGAWQGGV